MQIRKWSLLIQRRAAWINKNFKILNCQNYLSAPSVPLTLIVKRLKFEFMFTLILVLKQFGFESRQIK